MFEKVLNTPPVETLIFLVHLVIQKTISETNTE